ncbi:MAG: hypothetical protein Q7K57_32225 [Burkholderiaceae bacterium]|nr:hypothetical protein [Burkholderiaceae bacterium]
MKVTVGEIRNSTYDVLVEATLSDGQPIFSGTFSPVCIPCGERRAIPIPEPMRERLLSSLKKP